MTERTYPQNKIDAVAELEELIKKSNSVFLADFSGLNVEKINQLRDRFFEKEIQFRVVKNTLGKIALDRQGLSGLGENMSGPTALAFGGDDPAAPAKVIIDFAKSNDKPEVKSCYFEGEFYGPDKISIIKDLPTKDQLIAQVVGQLGAPLSNFVGVLNEIIRSFLGVLDAIIERKGGAAG
jgi:large subunit ribosomal protein L10